MMPLVFDDVLTDPIGYRARVLAQPRRSHTITPDVVFHGIAEAPDRSLSDWIEGRFPWLSAALSFCRLSPAQQLEPNYIHTDLDMGEWTGILYLNPDPPANDGTTFWRDRTTHEIASSATTSEARLEEWLAWRNDSRWEPWATIPAALNRLILFPAGYFHSRALRENWGEGSEGRLVQIVFGKGALCL